MREKCFWRGDGVEVDRRSLGQPFFRDDRAAADEVIDAVEIQMGPGWGGLLFRFGCGFAASVAAVAGVAGVFFGPDQAPEFEVES